MDKLRGAAERDLRLIAKVCVLLAPGVAAVVGIALWSGARGWQVFGDAVTDDEHVMTGALSNAGLAAWAATAAICWLTAFVLKGTTTAGFLAWSGAFTVVLLVDDMVQLHERVLPDALDLPEPLVVAPYGLFLVLYLRRYLDRILEQRGWAVLLIAFALFGVSALVDLAPRFTAVQDPFEDAMKLFGIATWLTYFSIVCAESLRTTRGANNAMG